MDDYELPDVERIVEEILKHLVKPGQIGPLKVETFDHYMDLLSQDSPELDLTDFDFIQINRRMGYLDESFTDVAGLDVQVWSKTRRRAVELMSQVTKTLLASETYEFLGFCIDYVTVLSGPDTNRLEMMEETMLDKSFEIHIRVKWKD